MDVIYRVGMTSHRPEFYAADGRYNEDLIRGFMEKYLIFAIKFIESWSHDQDP
jgi:hypothetical protein